LVPAVYVADFYDHLFLNKVPYLFLLAWMAKLLTGPEWSGHRVIELGSMVSADEVAEQLGEVLKRDVKAFAVPRAGWSEAFEQFGVPKGYTRPAEEMFESVNAGWMTSESRVRST